LILGVLITSCRKSEVSEVTPSEANGTDTTGLIIFSDDFESGNLGTGWYKELPNDDALKIIASPLGSGNCLRFELNYYDRVASNCRSELRRAPLQQLGEYWFGLSIFLPTDYEPDTEYKRECITQWHNIPDEDLGEAWGSPPVMLLTKGDGTYSLRCVWDTSRVTSDATNTKVQEYIDLGSYLEDKGIWVNWVYHMKWGWLSSHNPVFEVYKNGLKVVDRNGMPNTTNDEKAPYFKMGIYKSSWTNATTAPAITKSVVYFDNVKVMDSGASLADFTN